MVFDEIWRMQRKHERLFRAYKKKVETIKREHPDHWGAMMLDEESELNELSMNISITLSESLKQEAYSLRVPLPSDDDKTSWSEFFGPRILTTKGIADLRSRIRQERKERREVATAIIKDIFVPLATITISILSLLIAYAALKLKR
jgi:hypothetical protein